MRILFLSNFYPPARPGGYTQWCHEVAQSLEARGHTIGVLTSRHELETAPADEENIYRLLHLEGDLVYYRPVHFFTKWRKERRQNLAVLKRVIEDFSPEVIFVWGMWSMSRSIPALAEQLMPRRVVYYLSDYWPAAADMHTIYWQLPTRHWFTRLPKQILARIALSMLTREGQSALQFEHAICVSAAVREILVDSGLPLEGARVIHGGTDAARFGGEPDRDHSANHLRLLYAGQLVEHKGVHTAIEAMARLVHEQGICKTTLTLVGSGHPDYETKLRRMVEREHLEKYVTFHEPAPKKEIPAILGSSDVLVFPSIYEEPFARMTQEAMLAGLVVVGTMTGGTKELLVEGENGLTFSAGDADGLARQIARLVADHDLCRRLASAGRQSILNNYTLDRMVERIEAYLEEVVTPVQKLAVNQAQANAHSLSN